jgi:sugar transferase (PEP-CTERM system associated)
VIRLFNVHYPKRIILLLTGEALLVCASFVLAVVVRLGDQSFRVLNDQYGFYKILVVTGLAMLCLYSFDLYDLQRLRTGGETYFRLLSMLGALALLLAGVGYLFPGFLLGSGVFVVGLCLSTIALFSWRVGYAWLLRKPYLRERVYVLGDGERARQLAETLRTRGELGMELVGWAGALRNGSLTREALANRLLALANSQAVDSVIVALSDRRATMPVRELLDLRLSGIKVEDATGVLEKISGKIEVDELHPSWLIFSEGFRVSPAFLFGRRVISVVVSLLLLVLVLPLLPLIALAIKLTSPGPVLYGQKRVGRNGTIFTCYKFRTMGQDAEQGTGPTWASDDDPRVTRVGRLLRLTRLDELPQLWNVLKGDMGFVGPRPERPEFVHVLQTRIPYYAQRHAVKPGITGWAQINHKYGDTLEDAARKLEFDLYYIKNLSPALDAYILFHTLKTVLLSRGAQ